MKTILRRLLQITLATAIFFSMDVKLVAQDEQSSRTDESKIETSSVHIAEPTSKNPYSSEGLESKGISFNIGYRAESFGSLLGGVGNKYGANYLGSADMTIGFALDKLKLGRGHIVLSGQSLYGRGISERKVGTVQAVSNMEEGSFSKLIEAYYADSYKAWPSISGALNRCAPACGYADEEPAQPVVKTKGPTLRPSAGGRVGHPAKDRNPLCRPSDSSSRNVTLSKLL